MYDTVIKIWGDVVFKIVFLEKKIKDSYYVKLLKTLKKEKFSLFLKEIIIIEMVENYRLSGVNEWIKTSDINKIVRNFVSEHQEILCEYLKERQTPSRPNEQNFQIVIRNVTSSNAKKNANGLANRKEIEYCENTKSIRLSEKMINENLFSIFDRLSFIEEYNYINNYFEIVVKSEVLCQNCSNDEVVILVPEKNLVVLPEDIKFLCPNCMIKINKEVIKNVHVKEK